jgi:hypothetical protein
MQNEKKQKSTRNDKTPKRLIELKAQYRVLSEIEDCFVQNSKHPAAVLIQRKMLDIVNEISKLS